jgi:hypothetical membrane protein
LSEPTKPQSVGSVIRRIAGSLLFIGCTQYILGIILAEALYPGYSVSNNFISDLGTGPSALIWNSSVILMGIFAIASAYFIQRGLKSKLLSILLALCGINFIGVGIFPFKSPTVSIHGIFSLLAVFGIIFTIVLYRFEKSPLSYFSIVLGVISLVTGVLYTVFGIYLGLGIGGIQRIANYTMLIAMIGFGVHLIADSK